MPASPETDKRYETAAGRTESASSELSENNVRTLNELLHGMRYGTVTLIVQDGKVIQMDKTEKHRL